MDRQVKRPKSRRIKWPKSSQNKWPMPQLEQLILFDGVCNLCNAGVNFIIDRDPHKKFRFAALQSEIGRQILKDFDLSTTDFQTFVLIESERCYTRSTAALRVLSQLKGLWRLTRLLLLIPRPLRDTIYSFVAANRYKWFGRTEKCRISTPDVMDRFVTQLPIEA